MLQRAVLGETGDSDRQVAGSPPAPGHRTLGDTGSDYQKVSDGQAVSSLTNQEACSTGQDIESTAHLYSSAEMVSLRTSQDQPVPIALSDSITDLGAGSSSEDAV